MFHEQAALVGRGSRVAQPFFAGNVIFNAVQLRHGFAELIPTRTTARRAWRTNKTLLHRITGSVGKPFSSFGSLAPPRK